MMKTLRKAAIAVMFGILIVSFAISMGGNYSFFDRRGSSAVAKVGSIEISQQQFQRAYQRTLESLSQRAGRRLTLPEAQAIGLPDRVLQELVQQAAIDVEARRLGLGLSNEGLRDSITGNQVFRDSAGKFSPEKYQQFLQRIGYSAPVFEADYRGDLIRRQVRAIFEKSGIVPKVMLDVFNRYINEQRTISYFSMSPEAAGTIEAPSEQILKSYYEDRKAQFMAPEFRKAAVVAISPETVASRITVSDEDLKAEYAAKASHYAVPERRKIELIPFRTQQAAAKAFDQIKSGKDFLEVAKEAGFKQSDIDLGLVSKKEFADKFATNNAMIDAAFSLAKGEISAPVDGPLSSVIIRALEIIPGEEKSFDEVKDRIREDITKARATAESAKLVKAFENDRASGAPISEIGKKLNIPVEDVVIDRTGKGLDGKPANLSGVPVPALADAAFKSDVGVENEALRLPGGGYAWFEVQDIIKARQKPFDEVKSEVETAWRNDQVRTKLADKARELVAALDRGEPIAEVAKSIGSEVKTSKPLKRNSSEEGLSNQAVSQAFSVAEGAAGSSSVGDGTSRVVFQLDKVTAPAPLDEASAKALAQQLQTQMSDDNLLEFLSGILTSAGVSVDRKNFTAIAGGAYDAED